MTQGTWAIVNVAWWIALGAILDYFWMSWETLIILSAMLILDRIFWIVDAYMQNTLQSKVMVNGLIKKLTRWCFPFIVIAVLRWAGFGEVDLISTAMLSILIVAEWYSIVGHIYSINYKETLPEIDCLKIMMRQIAELFKKKADDANKK